MGFADDDDALVERTYLKIVNLIKAVDLTYEMRGPAHTLVAIILSM
jgi:hypothetical protein